MSDWNGRHGRGAGRMRREIKREEAEERNANSKPEDRRKARLARQKAADAES